ncbi:LAQU0S25e00496g1_1 [Lachancea quebecensis]|uniref:LAQU0S25e00496g1_1 n=1 Tax=Lachancea quebecensis TaxID=1654605 RepID=A0A0N7MMG4_9SACH|nr:LAQU0S25e00496g1_1 [Lachancea quebecensis]
MRGPLTSFRLLSTKSQPRNSLPRRLLKRLISPSADIPQISGWKQWLAHLKDDSRVQLKHLQDEIIKNVEVDGSVENTLMMGEINQFHFQNSLAEIKTPTLLLHGYAASSMAFHRNFQGLSKCISDLYAIDLPANGLSLPQQLEIRCTEPQPLKIEISNNTFKLPYTINSLHHKSAIQNFEDYYLDALEQWRLDNKLGPINVIAHSFGGYISFKYAVKYPQAVKKLCLVSPLGVERNIFSVNNNWRSNTEYKLDFENPASKFYLRKGPAIPAAIFELQTKVLRRLGPLGARLCWNYITAAYARVPDLKYKEYIFEMFYGKNGLTQTSKDIFTSLFTNRLLARDPLLDSLYHIHCEKLLLVYGDHDWMNRKAGLELVAEAEKLGLEAQYSEVSSSGHNLFLDNPEEFNDLVVSFLNK